MKSLGCYDASNTACHWMQHFSRVSLLFTALFTARRPLYSGLLTGGQAASAPR